MLNFSLNKNRTCNLTRQSMHIPLCILHIFSTCLIFYILLSLFFLYSCGDETVELKISNIVLVKTDTAVILSYTTNINTMDQINYFNFSGPPSSYLKREFYLETSAEKISSNNHSFYLFNLYPNTKYNYNIKSYYENDDKTFSNDYTFTTLDNTSGILIVNVGWEQDAEFYDTDNNSWYERAFFYPHCNVKVSIQRYDYFDSEYYEYCYGYTNKIGVCIFQNLAEDTYLIISFDPEVGADVMRLKYNNGNIYDTFLWLNIYSKDYKTDKEQLIYERNYKDLWGDHNTNIHGIVIDDSGNRIQNVFIEVYIESSDSYSIGFIGHSIYIHTDTEGYFVFDYLYPDKYVFVLGKESYKIKLLYDVSIQENQEIDLGNIILYKE